MSEQPLFQDQYRALVSVVTTIENLVKARVAAGGKGVHVSEVRQAISVLKLNNIGQQILSSLIAQSDLIVLSECQRFLIPAPLVTGKVIDAECGEERVLN